MNKSINTIVLSAGRNQGYGAMIGGANFTGMVPVRGRPSFGWCLQSLENNNVNDYTVVVRDTNYKLKDYLNGSLYKDKNIKIVNEDGRKILKDNILSSLLLGLKTSDLSKPTQVMLGDTFVQGGFPYQLDTLLGSKNVKVSKRWCMASLKDDFVNKFYDKKENLDLTNKLALVGYYNFSDSRLLTESVEKAIQEDKNELSDALFYYNQVKKLKIEPTDSWLDLGHVSGLVEARYSLFNAREFNSLSVNPEKGTIIKSSHKKQVLQDEVDWLKGIPKDVQSLAPRVLKTIETEDRFSYEMELFGYANLAETFVYDNNNIEDWMYILEKLFKVHKLLESHEVTSNKDDLEAIYVEKTIKRLNDLEKVQDFDKILAKDFIKINGEEFKNLPLIKDEVMKKCYELAEYQGNFGVTHGDYCFSNILFDPMFYIFRLVDPRGRFKDKSIYGDPRYDIAKLRHSVVGLYDFIVLGFYNIKQISANNFEFKILASKEKAVLVDYFDSLTERFGFNTSEIKLIEGLLFLTMIPLHGDSLNRQKAFYLTAIKKLNEALNER